MTVEDRKEENMDTKAGMLCTCCYQKDGHKDRCPLKPRDDGKIPVLLLGLNGGGPWMMFATNEDLTGVLATVLETVDEAIANEDEYTVKFKYMTQKEIDALPDFPGW
jgi:hypothetical protein